MKCKLPSIEEIQQWVTEAESFDIRHYMYLDERGRQQVDFERLCTLKSSRVETITINRENNVITALTFYNGQGIYFDGQGWQFKSDGVYLIAADNGLTKIGHSSDPQTRLAALQYSSPATLTLLHYWPMMKAPEVERQLHEQFSAKRKHGEWFDLSDTDITEIIRFCDER